MTDPELRAADAVVAKALGWRPGTEWWRELASHEWQFHHGGPPAYVSGGDWRLWGEMIEAFRKAGWFPRIDLELALFTDATITLRQLGRQLVERGATVGEALYLAGAAAGLWPAVADERGE